MLTSLIPRPFAHSLAARERDALCDLVLSLDATAPTLCEGWTAKDLVVHLLVRERRPLGGLGRIVPRLADRTSRASEALAERDLASLVAQLRSVPLPLAVVDPLLNGMEFFVHHEDVRRAQPYWTVRLLSRADQRHLWLAATMLGRMQARRAGVPLVIASGSRRALLRGGPSPVVVSGPVSEVLLFLSGRRELSDLTFEGPAERVVQVKTAHLGL